MRNTIFQIFKCRRKMNFKHFHATGMNRTNINIEKKNPHNFLPIKLLKPFEIVFLEN